MTVLETTRGRKALATSIIFTCLATFFVMVRVYTRAFMVKQMGADDYTILISLAFSWIFFGLFVGEAQHGMGEHIAKIPAAVLKTQMICFWASIPIYQTSLITTKASILLQYKRIFSTARMRLACFLLIGFLTVWGIWTIVSAWLNCVPVAKFWDDSIDGYCLDKGALWFSNSAIHITTDLLILLFPMPVLKALQLPKRQKIAVMGIFALGGFVLITSILRLHSLLVISNSTDPTYDNVGAATWSAVECNVAIICACLPGTRPVISKLLPRIFASTGVGYNSFSRSKNMHGLSQSHNIAGSRIQLQSSIAHDPGYDLELGDSKKGFSASAKEKEISGIQVTTYVSQQSTSHLPDPDETASLKIAKDHV